MSRVLKLMARRALGARPAVQPLVVPHLAPLLRARESTVSPAVEDPDVEPHTPRTVQRIFNRQTAEPLPGPSQESAAPPISKMQMPSSRNEAQEAPSRVQSTNPTPTESILATRPRRGQSITPHAEAFQSPVAAKVSDFTSTRATHDDVTAQSEDLDIQVQALPDSVGESMPRQHALKHSEAARQFSSPNNSENVSTQTSAPAASAVLREQNTEIHISIGSIELRPPRGEARPQPAPFRPRVTLNEFLLRKPEAGS